LIEIRVGVGVSESGALAKAHKKIRLGEIVEFNGKRYMKIKGGMQIVMSNHAEYKIVERA
jgi:hypothetical protein